MAVVQPQFEVSLQLCSWRPTLVENTLQAGRGADALNPEPVCRWPHSTSRAPPIVVRAQAAWPATRLTTVRAEQVIDSVDISLSGARPNVRGRKIWGGVVPWDRSWVAGANSPTVLEVGREFSINDTPIPAGKYWLWIVPRENDDWSLIVDPRTDVPHGLDPDSTSEQYHAHLTVKPIDHVETLNWSIPSVEAYRATVRMAWDSRAAEFTLRIKPVVNIVVAADVAATVVGDYTLIPDEDNVQQPADTAVFIRHNPDGLLTWQRSGGPDWEFLPEGSQMVLVPVGPDLFSWGLTYKGELVQYVKTAIWEFTRENGRIAGFEVRYFPSDRLWMSGTRNR